MSSAKYNHFISLQLYTSATYAFMVAASLYNDSSKKELREYVAQGINSGNKALSLINEVETSLSTGNKQGLYSFLTKQQEKERTKYIVAIIHAINAKEFNDSESMQQVKQLLDSLPAEFKEKFPLKTNKHLKWYR